MKLICLLLLFSIFIFLPSHSLSQLSSIEYLIEGRNSLKVGNFQKAEEYLTKALQEFKEIGDYILFWRAKAYKKMNKYEEALKDINDLKKNYSKSPILKDAKKEEIELVKILNLPELEKLYECFINEYPEEIKIKFDYAVYLKERGNLSKAKKIFKDIFITASPLAETAERELSERDITLNDLIKRAKALNNAYHFKKAEDYLRKILTNYDNSQKNEVLSLLGYSLFMQKKYTEAAEIFKKSGDNYWRARALLRSKNYEAFAKELSSYINSGDQRFSEVLINYANIQRRIGEPEKALKILKIVLDKYPHAREEALWFLAWNYYLNKDIEKAGKIFQELYNSYGKLKYLYWLEKVKEINGVVQAKNQTVSFQPGDIYSYLLYIKGRIANIPEGVPTNYSINYSSISSKRVDILVRAGFKEEVIKEIKELLKENRSMEKIPEFSKILYEMGDYPTSVRLISKIPDRFKFSELLYPQAYRNIVLNVSERLGINPYLIFAVMREESRFDLFARSPAGALGLMQLMPETAKREGKKIGVAFKNDSELFEVEKNILIGSFYLKKLIDEFGNKVIAIAAYNAGEKAVSSWLKENSYGDIDEFIEDIPFSETKGYVQKVLTSYFEYLRINKAITKETILKVIKTKGGKS
ncbi:MAG: transglycosylase SLT domain-containing protein [Thermodesulfovibrio sp.]|nr:transglycosylase SLT domain-containing protein [Thermodesulfovibrio sp.]MDW7998086.1 transglycosylase SLT domain-containing protein [Thermodesulfovibrio sp.]